MERELEIQEIIQKFGDKKIAAAYGMAIRNEWKAFKDLYEKEDPETLFIHLSINEDNAFHFAAWSKKPKLFKDLLGMVAEKRRYEAVMNPDDEGNSALHEAAKTNCVEVAKLLIDILKRWGNECEKKLWIRNKLGETPLYRAAKYGKTKMVQYMANQIDANALRAHFRRNDKMSILHIAVLGQHFETAIWLLEREAEVLSRMDPKDYYGEEEVKLAKREEAQGMTSFNLLALMPSAFNSGSSMETWKQFVYFCLPMVILCDNKEDTPPLIHEGQDLESGKNNNAIRQAKNKAEAISNISLWRWLIEVTHMEYVAAISTIWIALWRWLIEGYSTIKKIGKKKRKHELAVKLAQLLADQDTSWKETEKGKGKNTISLGLQRGGEKKEDKDISYLEEDSTLSTAAGEKNKRSKTEAPLLMAASNGIIEIVELILNRHPQGVEYVSDYGQNILHAAIKFRQKKVFDYVKSWGQKITNKLVIGIDYKGNTILHHVANMEFYKGGSRFGPAFQFQEELEWLENVKEIMPSHYIMHRNERLITAGDLFEEEHRDQFEKAQQWMKDTSESFSTVSILVATVVFAAAYTVPGGNDKRGIPVFLYAPLFWVFTILDVVSLICSLCSVVTFLSILTSPLKPEAFLETLPNRLMVGFTLLAFSVLSSMITFAAALLLLIRLKKQWTTFVVYGAVFIPVLVFAYMQFHLYYPLLGSRMKSFIKIFRRKNTKKKKKKSPY